MKKKLLLGALVCTMAFGSAMSVYAAEAETTAAAEEAAAAEQAVIEWDEEKENLIVEEGFGGKIMSIDALGMMIYIPDGLEQRDPTDDEKAKDTITVFENQEDGDKIEIVLGQMGDMKTLDDVQAYLKEKYPDMAVTPTKINEYDTLVFGNEEQDSMTVLISAEDAGFLRIICHPVKDEQKNKMFSLVAASLQQIKEETAAE